MYSILIADDEYLIRRGIISLVDFASLKIDRIFEAKNGEEAVEICKSNAIDFVLLDINMPKKDGLSAARDIRAINSNTIIAILTGYNYFDYAQTAIKIGVEDYLLKPVDKNDITDAIHNMVERKAKISITREINAIEHEVDQTTGDYQEIKDYMEENIYNRELSLNHVADQIGFNKSYLSSLFKQIYGLPFQDYVNKRRMNQAKLLLLTTDMKNYEICRQIGYDDVNYFSAKFKKAFGSSPKQYKSQVRHAGE